MPVFRGDAYREKIIAAADEIAASGALVGYSRSTRRPLVVFDSYHPAADPGRETELNKPIFRCDPSPGAYTSITLKARLVGLPEGKAGLVAVENDWMRHACHRDKKTGQYHVNVTLMGDRASRIRILGTGSAHPPIEYPFFRQVAVR